MKPITFFPVASLPFIRAGDDLASLMVDALHREDLSLVSGDVLIVTQKIVSKAADLVVNLESVVPSKKAIDLAAETAKDARFVEVVLQESRSIVARAPNVLIAEHVSGCILANAGVDRSNVDGGLGGSRVLLLPRDPDAAAARLREALQSLTNVDIGLIICDSSGRPWRLGTTGFALGVAGSAALHNHRGRPDLLGHPLESSAEAVADELAAAANLVMGQADEGVGLVIARGFERVSTQGAARDLLRAQHEDLFR